jgi:hypothetical protein
VFAVRNEQDLGKFGNRFIRGTSIGYAYGIHHDTEDFTFMSRFARARQEGRMSGATRPGKQHRNSFAPGAGLLIHRGRMSGEAFG